MHRERWYMYTYIYIYMHLCLLTFSLYLSLSIYIYTHTCVYMLEYSLDAAVRLFQNVQRRARCLERLPSLNNGIRILY